MRVLSIKITTSLIIISLSIFIFQHYKSKEVLQELKLRKNLMNEYKLIYKGQTIGGISGLDSWYVQDSQVYGSLSVSEETTQTNISFFFIDVCTDEIFITKYYNRFENFLDEKGIDKDKRNYMSGNNIVDMHKFKYSKSLNCT